MFKTLSCTMITAAVIAQYDSAAFMYQGNDPNRSLARRRAPTLADQRKKIAEEKAAAKAKADKDEDDLARVKGYKGKGVYENDAAALWTKLPNLQFACIASGTEKAKTMMWTEQSEDLLEKMAKEGKAACEAMKENMEMGDLMYNSMKEGACGAMKDKAKTDCIAGFEAMVVKPKEELKNSPTYLSMEGSANFRDCWAKSVPFKTDACKEMAQAAYEWHLEPVYEGYCDDIVKEEFKKECKGVYDDRVGWKAKVKEHLQTMSSASIWPTGADQLVYGVVAGVFLAAALF